MNFQFVALDHREFQHLFNLNDKELTEKSIVKQTVEQFPGTPCRITLEDALVGESVLLLPYNHQTAHSPYNSSGAIFVRNKPTISYGNNEIPKMFLHRLISIRAYDEKEMMIFADVCEGHSLKEKIMQIFENQKIKYLHLHNAKPGCYNCTVKRV